MPFNIGPGELIVILIVALLLFGPKKLPELGKAMGESIGAFKKAINGTPSGNAHDEGTVASAPNPATNAAPGAPAATNVTPSAPVVTNVAPGAPVQMVANAANVFPNAAPQQITVATPNLATSVGPDAVQSAPQNVGVSGATSERN